MIRILHKKEEFSGFLETFIHDECFSTPFYDLAKAEKVAEKEDCFVLGVYEEDTLTGVFAFLLIEEGEDLESMFCYSRDEKACREMMDYLAGKYPGHEVWFVINPKNRIMRRLLEEKQAFFFQEQYFMIYRGSLTEDVPEVFPYTESYHDDYIALHNEDGWWTGERMLAARDRFAIFLYVEEGELLGYAEVSKGEGTNEIFDILVKAEARNRGIGRRLMKKMIHENGSRPLILTVDTDNAPALHLYASLGFENIPENNALTAKYSL